MVEKSKKQKKGTISEEDVFIILQRYTAAAVLALLQEVAQIQDAKIDWNALVKRTATGITNPREYQMLWRHLAYRDELVEKLEDESKPLRWNIIKKRNNGNSIVKTGSQLSEVHLAARRALNMALDQPGVDSLKASSSLGRTRSNINNVNSTRLVTADTRSGTTISHDQACEDTCGPSKTFPKVQHKTSPKSLVNGPDPVKAAAVAAGARIATQSAAAVILKQQLKSAIHIKTGVTSLRDFHSPNSSRPHDLNPNVGPLNPVSTATQETNGIKNSSSANSPKKVQEDHAAVSLKVQDTSD
ncbi:hypothetical protein R6Q57_001760 [Mikania cordata]